MNLSGPGGTVLVVIALVLLMAAAIYIRLWREKRAPLGRAVSVFSDLRQNEKLADQFAGHWQVKRFKSESWQKNQNKLDFLPEELRKDLASTFEIVDRFNKDIDAAKQSKSDSYLGGINVEKLKPALAKSRQAVQDWVRANMYNRAYYPKRRGLFR